MIDQFLIFTLTGTVLYKYTPRKISDNIVNALISNVLISDSVKSLSNDSSVDTYTYNGYTLKYLRVNNPNFVSVAIFPTLTPLKYANELVDISSTLFKAKFGDDILQNLEAQQYELNDLDEELVKFDAIFKSKLQDYEADLVEEQQREKELTTPNKRETTPSSVSSSSMKKSGGKALRKWGVDGSVEEAVDSGALDFSTDSSADQVDSRPTEKIDTDNYGQKDQSGHFLVKDLNEEIEYLLSKSKEKAEVKEQFSFFKRFTGGKTITPEEIKKILKQLESQLIKKNVAPEAAKHLTSSVEKELTGSKTKSWTSVESTAKEALAKALTKILTPGTSVNLLEDIKSNPKPYVISVVGVNGVGKSTNLSKLAFWLLQNNLKVLIVACDTFRSGAVEQLRVHVRNLQNSSESTKSQIELYEGGYGGADLVAKIARNAIDYAKKNEFDVILMDTAGRRHNDAKLMSPLASFAKAANPNKIIMVGEALVGTDSIEQARNFNAAFGAGRGLDFFIISKCDTVGGMIGTLVNMVYSTNIPILFVGVGQTYTDLRRLSVEWAVNVLMS
ncbi:hypothetical protein WICPIJ_001509 [Wickerhamomyces pijperi]|uniref:Signal recognition particle receptor subunit alpha homolog n=1 Tax=Wickerhamomyces pijperi TaxID=599730 RepID=A0A9P8TQN9_WICPI|nr:hypothetical protein WICPIJ_001509 [Wickerhamomyces pijperi]